MSWVLFIPFHDSLLERSLPLLCWIVTLVISVFAVIGLSIALFLCVIAWKRSRTYEYMKLLPGRRERIPFIRHLIVHRALAKCSHIVDYNAQLLMAAIGFQKAYKEHGFHRFYIGSSPVVVLYSAKPVENILSNTVNLDKEISYKLLHPWLGTGLLTSTGNKWKSRRKLLTPAFHFRILDDFIPVFNKQSQVLVNKFRRDYVTKECVDIVPLVTLCTLDIICETIMGVSVNAQSNSQSSYVQAIITLGEIFTKRIQSPLLWPELFFRLSSVGKAFHNSLRVLHSFTLKVIRERRDELQQTSLEELEKSVCTDYTDIKGKNRKPFLDLLLLQHLKDKNNFTEEDIREEVDTFMFEGHDTTAMGISWALYLLGLYPEVQGEIQKELDSIFGDDRERPVTSEDLKKMRYMECALKECQRIYPSVPFIGRNTSEEMELCGYKIPKGTSIQTCIFTLHRDEKVWEKPEEFHPERFFPENAAGRHPFAYVPFSAGSRNCIGQKFAMMEEKIVIANILRNFNLISMDHRDKILLVAELVLRPKSGLRLKIIPRM